MDKEELSDVYEEVLKCLDSLLINSDPLAVAGCMLAQSLGVYRTIMDDDEFDKLMLAIYERKDEVQPFASSKGSLH
jgi:hypothetical protein